MLTKISYLQIKSPVGADDTGSADSTAAIQELLNTTQTAVTISPGTYKISATLTSAVANRTIIAYGATFVPTSAIAQDTGTIRLNASGQKIVGLTLSGSSAGASGCGGIYVGVVNDCSVTDCQITNFINGYGIVALGGGLRNRITNNFLSNCYPTFASGSQYGSIHCNASNSIISGNRIINSNLTGISGINVGGLTISNNLITGLAASSTSGGILIDGFSILNNITGNSVNNMAVEGIQIANASSTSGGISYGHVVSNNVISDCVEAAIALASTVAGDIEQVTISGNNITTSAVTLYAILLQKTPYVNITGNYINGYSTGIGFSGAGSDRVNLVGNTFENQASSGVAIQGNYWLVEGNRIIGAAGGVTTGISFDGTLTVKQLIIGNQIENCGTGISGVFSGTAANSTYVRSNHLLGNTTNSSFTNQNPDSSMGNCFDKVMSGSVTLVGGAATVSANQYATNDKVSLFFVTAGGTTGAVSIDTVTNATGFTLKSTSATDTSTYYWIISR